MPMSSRPAIRRMIFIALIGLAVTACSSTRVVTVQKPVMIPPKAQETCLPDPLPADKSFPDTPEGRDQVEKVIAADGVYLAGQLRTCDDKRGSLITAITGGKG